MGVPYEDIIELANESQKDMWINIPALATPDYVQNLAQLIYSNLDPNLNVYVEYSDETWNASFYEYITSPSARELKPAGDRPGQRPIRSSRSPLTRSSRSARPSTAYSALQAHESGRSSALSCPHQTSRQQVQLQFIQANYGTPSKYVYGVGIAPYVCASHRRRRRGPYP